MHSLCDRIAVQIHRSCEILTAAVAPPTMRLRNVPLSKIGNEQVVTGHNIHAAKH